MRSPYERSDRFHPPHDDLDKFQRDMDPVGEQAAWKLDHPRQQQNPKPRTNRSGASSIRRTDR